MLSPCSYHEATPDARVPGLWAASKKSAAKKAPPRKATPKKSKGRDTPDKK